MEAIKNQGVKLQPANADKPVKELAVVEQKTEKAKHRAITNFLIVGPVKALTPAAVTIAAGATGLALGGVPGAILGGAIGAQTGMLISDKVADVAGQAFDKGLDKVGEGVVYVAKKAKEGVVYVAKKVYERVMGKQEEPKLDVAAELDDSEFENIGDKLEDKVLPKVPNHPIGK